MWRQQECIQCLDGKCLMERHNFGYLGVDGMIILKWILKNWKREAWTGLIWLRIGTGTTKRGAL